MSAYSRSVIQLPNSTAGSRENSSFAGSRCTGCKRQCSEVRARDTGWTEGRIYGSSLRLKHGLPVVFYDQGYEKRRSNNCVNQSDLEVILKVATEPKLLLLLVPNMSQVASRLSDQQDLKGFRSSYTEPIYILKQKHHNTFFALFVQALLGDNTREAR